MIKNLLISVNIPTTYTHILLFLQFVIEKSNHFQQIDTPTMMRSRWIQSANVIKNNHETIQEIE